MQFKIVALSLLASLAAAETVQELTAELPSCAVTCINKAAQEQNCAADDQECKCKNATKIMEPAFECAADTCTANELDGEFFSFSFVSQLHSPLLRAFFPVTGY